MYDPKVVDETNGVALLKLAQPFMPNAYIQTVALPTTPRQPGVVGTIASMSHTGTLPPGQLAVFRGTIPTELYGDYTSKVFTIETGVGSSAGLCPGDSGSGFVTVENGRATVRGIASSVSITADCITPSGYNNFTDVFFFHNWILQTMGKVDASLAAPRASAGAVPQRAA